MNTGTKIRTVLAIATSINAALLATDVAEFNNPTVDMIYKIVSIILNFIIVAAVTYLNNDYTETASKYTGMMRQAKDEQGVDYDGEEFFEDEVEDDE